MATEKDNRRNILGLSLTSLFNDWSSEMIFPLLPAFMAEILGIPKTVIGLIDGISQGIASTLKAVSGHVSDRIGKRKILAVAGYALSNAVKPLLAAAHGWPLTMFVRATDRVGKGIRTAPRDALIADAGERNNRRGRAFAFHRAADTLGALLGTASAAIIMGWLCASSRCDTGTAYRTVFLAAAIPGILSVVCMVFAVREKSGRSSNVRARPALSWKALTPELRKFIVVSTLFGVGNFTFTFFLLRAREMGVAAATIPVAYLLHLVVYFGAAYPAGILCDRIGRKPVLIAGFALYILTAAGFAMTDSIPMAWVFLAVFGLHLALTDSTSRALVSDLAGSDMRGTALGVYHMGTGIADLPAGLLAGMLWDRFGSQPVFITGAAIAAAALLMFLTLRIPDTARQATR